MIFRNLTELKKGPCSPNWCLYPKLTQVTILAQYKCDSSLSISVPDDGQAGLIVNND